MKGMNASGCTAVEGEWMGSRSGEEEGEGGGGGGDGEGMRTSSSGTVKIWKRSGDGSSGYGWGLDRAGRRAMGTECSCKLPEHLIESVLVRLPLQSLFRFRSVCRSWNSLLYSSTFLTAYLEASIRHSVWFLVVTELGRFMDRTVATYDPASNRWHCIPLPSPLCDLDPHPTAADGGLVCYFAFENTFRTLFVCNPLTKSLRKLPQVLKSSSHISVLKMVMEDRITSSYKVFVVGMVPGCDSLRMEIYDSSSNCWKSSGIVPAKYPRRRPVYSNGVLYIRCYDRRSLLITYDMNRGAWNRIYAPLPHTLGYEELLQYQGHIFLVGVLEDNYKIESVCLWELQSPSCVWKEVDRMPRVLFMEFFCDRDYYDFQEDDRVLMKCCLYGDLILCVASNSIFQGSFKLLAYDLPHKTWRRLPDSFLAKVCRTPKFIEGTLYEPRLDAVA